MNAVVMFLEEMMLEAGVKPAGVRDLPAAQRAEYMRTAKAKSREKQREARKHGSPEPTTDEVRSVLADAALMLLAVEGPGSREILYALTKAFPGRAGVPSRVAARARSGRLSPRSPALRVQREVSRAR